MRNRRTWLTTGSLLALSIAGAAGAEPILPSGGQVTHGAATIGQPARGTLTVTQSSDRAVIDWTRFSVGEGGRVTFVQPGERAAVLNRVTGLEASRIAGALDANGQVYLVNPNGLVITSKGVIDARGGFIGSSLGIRDEDFLAGRARFAAAETAPGAVTNQGQIRTAPGGFAALLGGQVANEGLIAAPLGRVALGAGEMAALDFSGDGFLQVAAPLDALTARGEAVVVNSGVMEADGGLVVLRAAQARQAAREAVNMSGVIRARTVSGRDGAVLLGGSGGAVSVSGLIEATGETGGQVDIRGASLDLTDAAVIDVSGVRTGGAVVLMSDQQTTQRGVVRAQGARAGAVEISSAGLVRADLEQVFLGAGGRLRIDPKDILVGADPDDPTLTFLTVDLERQLSAGTDVLLEASNDISWIGGAFVDNPDGIGGDIRLRAGRNVSVQGAFSLDGGDLTITANDTGWAGFIAADRDPGWADLSFDSQVINAGTVSLGLLDSGDLADAGAGRIFVNQSIRADAIAVSTGGQAGAEIFLRGALEASGGVSLTGDLRLDGAPSPLTVTGRTVTWTNEATGSLWSESPTVLRFVEDGQLTRYGVIGPVDTARLALGPDSGAPAYSRVYGDANPEIATPLRLVAGTLQPGDALDGLIAPNSLSTTGPAARAPVGDHALTATATADFALADGKVGYFIDTRPAAWTLQVTRRRLVPTLSSADYVYGSPVAVATLPGVLDGDAVELSAVLDGGPAALSAMAGGFGLPLRLGAGYHELSLAGLSGAAAGNYQLDLTGLGPVRVTITPRPLTYAAYASAITYGDSASPSGTVYGTLPGDEVAPSGFALLKDGAPVDAAGRLAAGAYTVEVRGLTGAHAGNYRLADDGHAPGVLTVNRRPLTYGVSDAEGTYGVLAAPGPVSLHGVLGGDEVASLLQVLSGGAPHVLSARSPAGRYVLTAGSLTGADAGNYVLSSGSDGTLTIRPRPVTVSFGSEAQTYGSQVAAVRFEGVLAGDTLAPTATLDGGGRLLQSLGAGAFGFDARLAPGSHAFTLVGLGNSNYTLESAGDLNGALLVRPKPLTWSVADLATVYGTAAAPAATLAGLLPGDDVRGLVSARGVSLGARTPAGSYTLEVDGLAGAHAGNYVLAEGGHQPGALTVARRPVTFSVGAASSTYGEAAVLPGAALSNVLAGDELVGVIGLTTASGAPVEAGPRTPAGTYDITVMGLAGAAAANYTLSTGVDGVLTIQRRSLTYAVADVERVYGEAMTPGALTLTGVLSGDAVGADLVVTGPLGSIEGAPRPPDVGDYTVRASRLTGAHAGNYVLAASGHTPGALTVVPRLVTYRGGVHSYRYGDVPPPFTPALEGLLAGDNVFAETGVFTPDGTPAGGRLDAGSYVTRVLDLTGAHAGNYRLAPSGHLDGRLTVTPRAVTARVAFSVGERITYGQARPETVTASVALLDLLPGDTLDTVLSNPALTVSGAGYLAAGTYVFHVGLSGPDAANYVLSDGGRATLTVTPKPLPYALTSAAFTYGEAPPDLTATFSGALPGDEVGVGQVEVLAGGAWITPHARLPVGAYGVRMNALSGADGANYVLGLDTPSLLTVTPRPVAWSIGRAAFTYGDTPVLPEVTLRGLLADDVGQVEGTLNLQITSRLPARTHVLTLAGLTGQAARNYTLASEGNTAGELVVRPRTLGYAVPASDLSLAYADRLDGAGLLRLEGVLDGDAVWAEGFELTATGPYEPGQAWSPRSYRWSGAIAAGATLDVAAYAWAPLRTGDRYLLSGPQAANYVLPAGSRADFGRIVVRPREITYAVADYRWVYGDGRAVAVSFGNLAGWTPAHELELRGPDGAAAALGARTPVGDYAIRPRLIGSDARNYVFAPSGNADGRLVVVPRPVTAQAVSVSAVYGDAPTLVTLQGVLSGDAVTPTARVNGGAAEAMTQASGGWSLPARTPVGEHAYQVAGLAGPAARNYVLNAGDAGGRLSLSPRTIAWSVADVTGLYGGLRPGRSPTTGTADLTTGAVTFDRLVPGDVLEPQVRLVGLGGVVMDYAPALEPGSYFQVVTGIGGPAAGNYRLAETGNVAGQFTIERAWLGVGVQSGALIYANGEVVVIGQPGKFSFTRGLGVTGLVGDDDVQPVLNIEGYPPVGSHLLEAVALAGADAHKYRLAWSTQASLEVTDASALDFALQGRAPLTQYYTPPPPPPPPPAPTPTSSADGTTASSESSAGASAGLGTLGGSAGAGAGAGAEAGVTIGEVSLSAVTSATTEALAAFGVQGAKAQAQVEAAAEVRLEAGPFYAVYGAGAEAGASAGLSLLSASPGVKLAALAKAGVYERGGVEGEIGGGVSGAVGGAAELFAMARSSAEIGYSDGQVRIGQSQFVGVGASVGAEGGISGGGVGVEGAIKVYSPGSLKIGADMRAGYSDGEVTVGFTLALSIGIGGLEISPQITFSVGWAEDLGGVFATLGGADTSTVCDAACRFAAKTQQAVDLRQTGTPLEFLAYLEANPDVREEAYKVLRQGDLEDPLYRVARFHEAWGGYPAKLSQVYEQQKALLTKVSENPAGLTVEDVRQINYLRREEGHLIRSVMNVLRADIVMADGKLTLVAR